MIKVIRKGDLRRITCYRCNSYLEYDAIDDTFCDSIRYDSELRASIYSWYIRCPVCYSKIKVKEGQ